MIIFTSYWSVRKTDVSSETAKVFTLGSGDRNYRCGVRQTMFFSRLVLLLPGALLLLASTVAYGVSVPVEVGQLGEQYILYRGGQPANSS